MTLMLENTKTDKTALVFAFSEDVAVLRYSERVRARDVSVYLEPGFFYSLGSHSFLSEYSENLDSLAVSLFAKIKKRVMKPTDEQVELGDILVYERDGALVAGRVYEALQGGKRERFVMLNLREGLTSSLP